MAIRRPFRVRAPGRVCLFGEHSDYIGLDVIPAAINLTVDVIVYPRDDNLIKISYVDLNETDQFELGKKIPYRHKRDYFRSAFNVLSYQGIQPQLGVDIRVEGRIPIAAGLSSSSALSLAAVMTVAQIARKNISLDKLIRLAFQVEVAEFGESGGMQDHYASGCGGIIHLDLGNDYRVTRLPAKLDGFVIGDSQETKADTVGDIEKIKSTVEKEYELISLKVKGFDRRTTPVNCVYELSRKMPNKRRAMAEATLRNRNLTSRAFKVLKSPNPDPNTIGEMLDEHHEIIRDGYSRSTPKIERMIKAAKNAGALCCKINGSGGGGTMLAYAPDSETEVSNAIQKAGGVPYITKIGQGATLTILRE